MKNITLLIFITLSAIFCLSNLNGALPENTDAPGDLTCGRAPCHNVPVNVGNALISVTVENGLDTYQADSTYSININIDNPITQRNGFQILALDVNNENAGAWELTEPSAMKIINGFSVPTRKYVTHQSSGNLQTDWSMNWVAPNEDVGEVTFYCSVLSGNDNGMNTGDEVYTTSTSLSFSPFSWIDHPRQNSIRVFPTYATEGVWIDLPVTAKNAKVVIVELTGKVLKTEKYTGGGLRFLEIKSLSSGLYFVQIFIKERVETHRIIVG